MWAVLCASGGKYCKPQSDNCRWRNLRDTFRKLKLVIKARIVIPWHTLSQTLHVQISNIQKSSKKSELGKCQTRIDLYGNQYINWCVKVLSPITILLHILHFVLLFYSHFSDLIKLNKMVQPKCFAPAEVEGGLAVELHVQFSQPDLTYHWYPMYYHPIPLDVSSFPALSWNHTKNDRFSSLF